MNKDYRELLLSKLCTLRGMYIRQSAKISPSKENKLYRTHASRIIKFYEKNKSKELLDFLLKCRNIDDIDLLYIEAVYIARQASGRKRKLLANACLKGLGKDYIALYVVSNQKTSKDMKKMIDIYFGSDPDKIRLIDWAKDDILENKIELIDEPKEKILKRKNK